MNKLYGTTSGIKHDSPSNPSNWMAGTSTTLFQPAGENDLQECKSAGIDCIELCLFGKGMGRTADEIKHICGNISIWAKSTGLKVWSIHLPFGADLDISCINQKQRLSAVKYFSELMEWAAGEEIRIATIHPSSEPIETPQRPERIKYCKESLSVLAEKAQNLGINLAVEVLPRTCLGNTSSELKELISINDTLGVCMDVNHLLLETHEQFIKTLGSRIITLHISDYDGIDERHWLPGNGIIKWSEVIGHLSEAGYQGPFMFETRQSSDGKDLRPANLVSCWHDLLKAYNAP